MIMSKELSGISYQSRESRFSAKGYFLGVATAASLGGALYLGGNIKPEQYIIFGSMMSLLPGIFAVIPRIHRAAMRSAKQYDEVKYTAESTQTDIPPKPKWMYLPDLLLMWTPNIFNPNKLIDNITNPIGEVFHTKHIQYPVKDDPSKYIVEHKLFGKLVTVDLVERDRFRNGPILRLKQLFDRRFYYGHAQEFPKAFRLISRTFVQNPEEFDVQEHAKRILDK